MTRKTIGYALLEPGGDLQPRAFERRALRPDDVEIRVTFCGVCHTDLRAIEAAQPGVGPLVPGHEFVGEVTAVGADVTGFAVGDAVAVGNIASCWTWQPRRHDDRDHAARSGRLGAGVTTARGGARFRANPVVERWCGSTPRHRLAAGHEDALAGRSQSTG